LIRVKDMLQHFLHIQPQVQLVLNCFSVRHVALYFNITLILMASSFLPLADAVHNSICTPVIFLKNQLVASNTMIPINDTQIIWLRCQCQEEVHSQSGEMPLQWTLRGSSSHISQVGSYFRPFTADLTLTGNRYDTRPTYFCHGRDAEPSWVSKKLLLLCIYSLLSSRHCLYTYR
jgi:hypothetical protein